MVEIWEYEGRGSGKVGGGEAGGDKRSLGEVQGG